MDATWILQLPRAPCPPLGDQQPIQCGAIRPNVCVWPAHTPQLWPVTHSPPSWRIISLEGIWGFIQCDSWHFTIRETDDPSLAWHQYHPNPVDNQVQHLLTQPIKQATQIRTTRLCVASPLRVALSALKQTVKSDKTRELGASKGFRATWKPPLLFFWIELWEVLLTRWAGKHEPRWNFQQGWFLHRGHLGSAC